MSLNFSDVITQKIINDANWSSTFDDIKSKLDSTTGQISIFGNSVRTSVKDKIAQLSLWFNTQEEVAGLSMGALLQTISEINLPTVKKSIEFVSDSSFDMDIFLECGCFLEINQIEYDNIVSYFTSLDDPITLVTKYGRYYNFSNEIVTSNILPLGSSFEIEGICSHYAGQYSTEYDVPFCFHVAKDGGTYGYYLAIYPFDHEESYIYFPIGDTGANIECLNIFEVVKNLGKDFSMLTTYTTICNRVRELGEFAYSDIVTELKNIMGDVSSEVNSVLQVFQTAWNRYGLTGVFTKLSEYVAYLGSINKPTGASNISFSRSIQYISSNIGLALRGIATVVGEIALTVLQCVAGVWGIIARAAVAVGSGIVNMVRAATDAKTYAQWTPFADQAWFPQDALYTVQDIGFLDQSLQSMLLECGAVKIVGVGNDLLLTIYESSPNVYKVQFRIFVTTNITSFPTSLYNYISPLVNAGHSQMTLPSDCYNSILSCYYLDKNSNDNIDIEDLYNQLEPGDFDKRLRQIWGWNLLYSLLSIIGCTDSASHTYVIYGASSDVICSSIMQLINYDLFGDMTDVAWSDTVESDSQTNFKFRYLHTKTLVDSTYYNFVYYDATQPQAEVTIQGILTRIYPSFMCSRYSGACIYPVDSIDNLAITLPKFDRFTFICAAIVTALTVVATVATTIVLSYKVRNTMNRWSAKLSASCEKAWSNFQENPTASNYRKYRASCTKNNILAKLTHGTKYSKTGFWNDTGSSDNGLSNGALSDSITGYLFGEDGTNLAASLGIPTLRTISDQITSIDPGSDPELSTKITSILNKVTTIEGKVNLIDERVVILESLIH